MFKRLLAVEEHIKVSFKWGVSRNLAHSLFIPVKDIDIKRVESYLVKKLSY